MNRINKLESGDFVYLSYGNYRKENVPILNYCRYLGNAGKIGVGDQGVFDLSLIEINDQDGPRKTVIETKNLKLLAKNTLKKV